MSYTGAIVSTFADTNIPMCAVDPKLRFYIIPFVGDDWDIEIYTRHYNLKGTPQPQPRSPSCSFQAVYQPACKPVHHFSMINPASMYLIQITSMPICRLFNLRLI